MEQKCPHCGAVLPREASFCPHCARSVNKRTQARAPIPFPWRRALRIALPLLMVLALLLGRYLSTRPKAYDDGGTATVTYTDADGSYQLLLGWMGGPDDPAPELWQDAEAGGQYRFPACLFVHDTGSSTAAHTFLQRVERITARFDFSGDQGEYITYTDPAPNGYCPEAAAVSFIDFQVWEDRSAVGTWTVTMKNGDVITLRQTLNVEVIQTLDYYPEDWAMGTTEELQSLIDEIGETTEPSNVVNIHLPAVTYEGDVTIGKRPVNLLGVTEGEDRTVFTGTLRITTGAMGWINEIQDIDFVGGGREGLGVTAAARVHMLNCTFTGWKTAVLVHGHSWVNLRYCEFADNEVGFHFNASESSVSHSIFDGNRFTENGTALLWEGIPVGTSISFPESVFSLNGTDIDNRSGQVIDISEAVFQ